MVKWMYRGVVRERGLLSFSIYLRADQIEVLRGKNSSGERLTRRITERLTFIRHSTTGEVKLTRLSFEKPGHKDTIHGQIRFECRSKDPDSDVIVMLKLMRTIRLYVVETTGCKFARILPVKGERAEFKNNGDALKHDTTG